MRKIPNHKRLEFIRKFADRSFTMEEVDEFLRDDFKYDHLKEERKARRRYSERFVRSFKDEDGIREFNVYNAAGEGEPLQLMFNLTIECQDVDILTRQEDYAIKEAQGHLKRAKKINQQKHSVLSQITMFDFIGTLWDGKDEEKRSKKKKGTGE